MNYFQNGNNHRGFLGCSTGRLATVAALLLLAVLIAPETGAMNTERGYASAYGPGVTNEEGR